MSIQITISAASAVDVKQLVSDLANTMSGIQAPAAAPAFTQQPPAAPVAPLAAVPAAPAPVQQSYVPPTQPPAAVPTAGLAPQQPAPMQPSAAVPTAAQTYTVDQLAVAATQLMDAGRQPELVGLLNHFGVQSLTSLPKEQYGAFATALRGMGAKI